MNGRLKEEISRSFDTGNPLSGHSMNQGALKEAFDGTDRLRIPRKEYMATRRRLRVEGPIEIQPPTPDQAVAVVYDVSSSTIERFTNRYEGILNNNQSKTRSS